MKKKKKRIHWLSGWYNILRTLRKGALHIRAVSLLTSPVYYVQLGNLNISREEMKITGVAEQIINMYKHVSMKLPNLKKNWIWLKYKLRK